jgi:hypothetical protein
VSTVSTGRSCSASSDIPPPDGDLVVSAAAGTPLEIDDVPVGAPLTVTVRAGHFAGGCVDLDGIVADEVNLVPIQVTDRPLQMGAARFDLQLGIEDELSWRLAFDPAIDAILVALLQDAPSDAARLLDAMTDVVRESSEQDAELFENRRASALWDTVLADALGSRATDGLRDGVRARLLLGLERLAGPDAIVGTLTASATARERASLDIATVAGLSPAVAGFPSSLALTWSSGAADTVRVGGVLTWGPSKLLTALADAKAGSEGAAALVANDFGCTTVGETLASTDPGGFAYGTCDAVCVTSTCQTAVRRLWDVARAALADAGTLEIAASGRARIDDEAVPVGFDGEWVGGGTVSPEHPVRFEGPAVGGTESEGAP